MSHVLLILPDPDWIQLSNIYMKFDKHMFTEAYTLSTIKDKLARLTQNSKIHIIGHGDEHGPQGTTVKGVADALRASKMPDAGVSIRLDTCSSAGNAGGNNFCEALLRDLKNTPPNYKTLRVEGTTGSSITGFKEGREVVDPNFGTEAGEAQDVLTTLFYDELAEAAKLADQGWRDTLSSIDIRSLSFMVHLKTSDFFKYFRKYLVNLEKVTGDTVLLNKKTTAYKQSYT